MEKNRGLINIIISIVLTAILTGMGFYMTRLYTQLDSKVDNKVLVEYMKLIEERQNLQRQFNDSMMDKLHEFNIDNKEEHKELMKKIELINEQIHALEIRTIGFINTRNIDFNKWDLQAVTLFMLENRKDIYPKNVGLI